MTAKEIMTDLQSLGSEQIKKILMKHGAREPLFGVKIGELKKIQKKVKTNYQLSLDLYDTGNGDAMYLAGLVADDMKMTKKDLQRWVEKATGSPISEYTVPWVASGGRYGLELGREWIESPKEHVAAAGWNTLGAIVALQPDEALDMKQLKSLMERVFTNINKAPNRVRYAMNSFIIAVGSYVAPLHDDAVRAAKKIGTIEVDMNGTSCKVPAALDYINKIKAKGNIGKKKKTVKC